MIVHVLLYFKMETIKLSFIFNENMFRVKVSFQRNAFLSETCAISFLLKKTLSTGNIYI